MGWVGQLSSLSFILTLDKKKLTRNWGYLVGGSDLKISKAKITALYACVFIFFIFLIQNMPRMSPAEKHSELMKNI